MAMEKSKEMDPQPSDYEGRMKKKVKKTKGDGSVLTRSGHIPMVDSPRCPSAADKRYKTSLGSGPVEPNLDSQYGRRKKRQKRKGAVDTDV